VLFDKDKTLHSGHWTRVHFGTKSKFFERPNGILSLVVLTWMRQLQQFFLNEEKKDQNGDWNTLGKYTGITTNNMKETTPLANINFSSVSTPNTLTQITKVKQVKPTEEIKGVCTSLEEWALCILSAPEQIQLKELYNNDSETQHRVDRVCDSQNKKRQKKFSSWIHLFLRLKTTLTATQTTKSSKDLTQTQTEMKNFQHKN
jgi:hypothetical protein